MKSVTKSKLVKISNRNIRVRKEQAIAKVDKQRALKIKTELQNLEQMAFELSNPIERLSKSPTLEYTRHMETVKRTLAKDISIVTQNE